MKIDMQFLNAFISGNFLWMTIEFIAVETSSNVHWGPRVPLGSMPDSTQKYMNDVKLTLFAMSLTIQFTLYLGLFLGCLEMPAHFNEDVVLLNEINYIFGQNTSQENQTTDADMLVLRGEANLEHVQRNRITTAFVEYTYIVFWIMKDLFWSCGTGDIETNNEQLAIFLETIALLCGVLALGSYVLTAYISRRDIVGLADSISTLSWIAANYVWMGGEFFVRYKNLELDDLDEGNDENTRIASTAFFLMGFFIQVVVILIQSMNGLRINHHRQQSKNETPRIEMFTFNALHAHRFHNRLSSITSQLSDSKLNDVDDQNEEMEVIF
jgi:hypothetical protein